MVRKNKKNRIKEGFIQKNGVLSGVVGAVIIGAVTLIIAVASYNKPIVQQKIKDQSSDVKHTGSGNIIVSYKGLPQVTYERFLEMLNGNQRLLITLLDQLDVKNATKFGLTASIEEAKRRISDLLANKLISVEVKVLIKEGKFDEAERLVDRHGIEQVQGEEKDLAAKLYERAAINELKLKYSVASISYEKAALLQPNNSLYQNSAGLINDTLGRHDKAIRYYELALASDLKTFGENHPK
ncbi:MAG: hypothetical protein HRT37_23485, partial [Alteromonadaceae bacterium]|nr:hypothetical protein [Alteromonadaceae bacterium]